MADAYLQSRLDFLLKTQNADGAWGYFPGKQSWLEPTAYAILALHGRSEHAVPVDRAWRRISAWRMPDGGWKPAAQVQEATWVTSLGLIVACSLGLSPACGDSSVAWLIQTCGAESRLTVRLASYFHLLKTEANFEHRGWPWRPGTSAWIEPTALSLLALKKVLESAKAAAGAPRQFEELTPKAAGGESVLREFLPSAKAAADGARQAEKLTPNAAGGESVLREFLPSAKAADDGPRQVEELTPKAAGGESVLREFLKGSPDARLADRIRDGEDLILSRKDRDGGWNCGNPNVLNVDAPSYPETTALAMLGLQGRNRSGLAGPISVMRRYLSTCKSPLAEAWLTIALRCYGEPASLEPMSLRPDVLLCALQALAHPAGNYRFLRYGGAA